MPYPLLPKPWSLEFSTAVSLESINSFSSLPTGIMSPQLILFLAATAVFPFAATEKLLNCEEFSAGVIFEPKQAVGSWHLMRLRKQPASPGSAYCLNITETTTQERNELQKRLSAHVKVNWQHITLKMQIPCGPPEKIHEYYLETMERNGSFMTLQEPYSHENLATADYNRHPMKLKIVEGEYLAMMDCMELFMFLLSNKPLSEDEMDPQTMNKLEKYLPDKFT